MMAQQCEDFTRYHVAIGDWHSDGKAFYYGSQPLPVTTFAAGQTRTVRVEMDFGSTNRAKDWSVIVHGEKAGGTVSIIHKNGWTSDKLPVIASRSPPSPSPTPTDPCSVQYKNWWQKPNSCNVKTQTEADFKNFITSNAITRLATVFCDYKQI